MRPRLKSISIFAAAMMSMAATSCFTGIESTPKITDRDVRENGVRVTAEQSFSNLIQSQVPRTWQPGKEWIVDDDKIAYTFSSQSSKTDNIAGHKMRFAGIRTVPTLTGEDAVELELIADDGRIFYHRTGVSWDEWQSRQTYSIPFTVELSAVQQADSIMRGKTYYINIPRWRDKDGKDINGQRHVPVRIESVEAGNHIYPLLVGFKQLNRPQEDIRYVFMTYGPETASTRNFDRLFSFNDPRKSYPHITDQTWEKIINSQISEGMTRDECRLALGTPASIQHGATQGGAQLERWSYENGVYLLFEDGILTKFRN